MTLAVIVPFTVFSYVVYTRLASATLERARRDNQRLLAETSDNLSRTLDYVRADLTTLSKLPLFQDHYYNVQYGLVEEARLQARAIQEFLRLHARRVPAYSALFYFDAQGQPVARSSAGPATPRNCLERAKTLDLETVWFYPGTEAHTSPCASIRLALSEREPLGLLVALLDRRAFLVSLQHEARAQSGQPFLLDRNGKVIFHPRGELIGLSREELARHLSGQGGAAILRHLTASTSGAPDLGNGNESEDWTVLSTRVAPASWTLGIAFSKDAVLSALEEVKVWTYVFSTVTLLAIILMVFTVARRLTAPIHDLAHQAASLGQGDLTVRARVNTGDELELLANVFNDMAGNLQMSLAQLEDTISDLRTTQDQLVQAEKLAALGKLSAGVAHEINNPLGSILAAVRVIIKMRKSGKSDPEDFTKQLRYIKEDVDRAREIVSALLDYSRQSAPAEALETVRINQTVEDALRFLRHRLEKREVELSLEATCPVQGEVKKLQQVLVNLITNALKATERDGRIAIRTRDGHFSERDLFVAGYRSRRTKDMPHEDFTTVRAPGTVRRKVDRPDIKVGDPLVSIEIEDDGHGMTEEHCRRIFDPFYTTRPLGEGTGLGLSIVMGIVQQHSGLVEVESAPGAGSTFTVKLPALSPPPHGDTTRHDAVEEG